METRGSAKPLVVGIEMGYGHLRAAQALADAWGTNVVHADRPPLADASDARLWNRARFLYEHTSRGSQAPLIGPLMRRVLDEITAIDHLYPHRDQSAPTRHVHALSRLVRRGLGAGLAAELRESKRTLVTTYFSAALCADHHGLTDIWCVVTDSDLSRAWVAEHPLRSSIRYLAPTWRAVRRLRAYGVPDSRIHHVGFPLPIELVGGPGFEVLKANLAARLVRLDTSGEFLRRRGQEAAGIVGELPLHLAGTPPLVTFAVGGAGAQADLAAEFLPGLRRPLAEGRLRLALVAGTRTSVATRFRDWLHSAGLAPLIGNGVEILAEPDFNAYYTRFNELLARTDVLWTKPGELVFHAGLGLPLVLSWPIGVHEIYNRRFVTERGAGLRQGDPRHAGEWLLDWMDDGLLAAAALSGFLQLPSGGTRRILAAVDARSG